MLAHRLATLLLLLIPVLLPACGEDPAADTDDDDTGLAITDEATPTDDDDDEDADVSRDQSDDDTGGADDPPPVTKADGGKVLDASSKDAGTSPQSGDASHAKDSGDKETGAGSKDASSTPPVEMGNGMCCEDGNCICRGLEPTPEMLKKNGSFKVADYDMGFKDGPTFLGAKIWYPMDAAPPLSGIVLCPGLTGVIADLAPWGPFLASHGIVTMVIDTNNPGVDVNERAVGLMEALASLKAEQDREGSPLKGKLSKDRYGMGGWSMGGGATWINTGKSSEIKTGMTLAGHNWTVGGGAVASMVKAPTIMFAGSADPGILGGDKQSQNAYTAIPANVPKLLYEVNGGGHWDYNTPTTNMNMIGYYGLAFQKTYLEGDTRYRKFLLEKGPNASDWQTNIQ